MIDVSAFVGELEAAWAQCMATVESTPHVASMALAYAVLVNKMLSLFKVAIHEIIALQQEVGELRNELLTRN